MTTPSEWLLEQYDATARGAGPKPTNHIRPLAEILDDHRGPCTGSTCLRWPGAARWPNPAVYAELGNERAA